jgi:hypothetical protein
LPTPHSATRDSFRTSRRRRVAASTPRSNAGPPHG